MERGRSAQRKAAKEVAACAADQTDEEDKVEAQTTAGAFDDADVQQTPVFSPGQRDHTNEDVLE